MSRPPALAQVALVAAVLVALAVHAPFSSPVHLGLVDDAFYYLQIAQQLADGNGFTFDGIHQTNGFHPAWLAVAVVLQAVLPGADAPVYALFLCCVLLIAATAWLLFRSLSPRVGLVPAALAALWVVVAPNAPTAFASGMEASLSLFLLALIWSLWSSRADEPGFRSDLTIGLLCAFAFLTRLEHGLLLPVLLLADRAAVRAAPRRLFPLVAPLTIAVAAFLSFELLTFGELLPISGEVKRYWGGVMSPRGAIISISAFPWFGTRLVKTALELPGPGAVDPYIMVAARVGASLVLLGLVVYYRRVCAAALQLVRAAPFVVFSVLVFVAQALVLVAFPPWYLAPIVLSTALLVAALGKRLLDDRRRLTVFALVVAALLMSARAVNGLRKLHAPEERWTHHARAVGYWLSEHTPEHARIGTWNAGIVGYYSNRPVVNLDGLVNDRTYFEEVVVGKRLANYLERERVGYLSDIVCGEPPQLDGMLRLYGGEELGDRLRPVFVSVPKKSCHGFAVFEIGALDEAPRGSAP